jgi:hypothetical protein
MKPLLYHYFELLSLILAIIFLTRGRPTFIVWFIPFLALTLFTELYASYSYYVSHLSTGWIYNILNPVSQAFYSYIFYRLYTNSKHRRILVGLTMIYILFYLFFYGFFVDINTFNNYLVAVGGVMQVIFACLFFYQCLKTDVSLDNKLKSGLWIAGGVLIFYSGITLCLSLYNYIKEYHLTLGGIALYNVIPRALSIILYCCLSISFITWRRSMPIK